MFFILRAAFSDGIWRCSVLIFLTLRESIGSKRSKAVLALSFFHLVFFIAYNLLSIIEKVWGDASLSDGSKQKADSLLLANIVAAEFFLGALPSSISHVIFYYAILRNLKSTRILLASRRQTIKKAMFDRLYCTLRGFFIASAAFAFFSGSFQVTCLKNVERFAQLWTMLWVFIDGWPVIFNFVATLVLAYIWHPRSKNIVYGLHQLSHDPSGVLLAPRSCIDEISESE